MSFPPEFSVAVRNRPDLARGFLVPELVADFDGDLGAASRADATGNWWRRWRKPSTRAAMRAWWPRILLCAKGSWKQVSR